MRTAATCDHDGDLTYSHSCSTVNNTLSALKPKASRFSSENKMSSGPGLKRAGISTQTESFPVSVLLNGKEVLQDSITDGQEQTVIAACFYLTGYAPHLQFTGIVERENRAAPAAARWCGGWHGLCGVCMFSRCLRGLPSGPSSSFPQFREMHARLVGGCGWSLAVSERRVVPVMDR